MADFIIHDTTPEEHFIIDGLGRGLDLSERTGEGYAGVADPFPAELLIPRSEWQARIEERVARKTQLSDLMKQAGLKSKNQGQLNYCWVYAPTHCVEIVRMKQNQPQIALSAASVGGQITGYRNVGGWGKTALQWIANKGVAPESAWPDRSLNSRLATSATAEMALGNRVQEWTELEPGNLDQLVSMLLWDNPVAIGLAWWSHEITAVDPIWLDGTIAIRGRNQWWPDGVHPWGDDNYFTLQGSRMLPDDAVAPRVAMAS